MMYIIHVLLRTKKAFGVLKIGLCIPSLGMLFVIMSALTKIHLFCPHV